MHNKHNANQMHFTYTTTFVSSIFRTSVKILRLYGIVDKNFNSLLRILSIKKSVVIIGGIF